MEVSCCHSSTDKHSMFHVHEEEFHVLRVTKQLFYVTLTFKYTQPNLTQHDQIQPNPTQHDLTQLNPTRPNPTQHNTIQLNLI